MFQCRFCDYEVKFYVGVVCHEVEVHSLQFSCVGCEGLVAKLGLHFRTMHVGAVVSRSSCDCRGERLSVSVTANYDPLCKDDEDGRLEAVDNVDEWNFVDVKIESVDPDEDGPDGCALTTKLEPDADFFTDLPKHLINPLSRGLPFNEDLASEAESSYEENITSTAMAISRKSFDEYEAVPFDLVDAVFENIDALSMELNKSNGGLVGWTPEKDWISDTDDDVFCPEFRDILVESDDYEIPCREDAAAARMLEFVNKFQDTLKVLGPRRDGDGVTRDSLLCSQCALPFGTKSALMVHQSRVHGDESEKVFRCKKCEKSYTQRSCLVRHCAWMRFGKKFMCKMPRREEDFTSVAERTKPSLEDHGRIACQQCDKSFFDWNSWRLHMDAAHDNNKAALICGFCNSAEFTKMADLKKHELKCRSAANMIAKAGGNGRSRGTKSKFSSAPADGKAKLWASQNKYQERKKEAEQKCTICCVKWYNREKRLQHEQECHYANSSGAMCHKCSVCAAIFPRVGELNDHMKTKHGYGKHKCPHCPKLYMSIPAVHGHVAREHGQARYKCDQCGVHFFRKGVYDDHMARHEGKAKYTCQACGKQMFHYPTWYDHKNRYCPMLEKRRPRSKRVK